MSQSDGGPGRREVAYRLFAAEFEDADMDYSESDEERAPNYVVTPTGGRVNRLYVVGVLTEVEPVSDDVLRARVVDPSGAFVLYAGQYQQDERAFLERADPPAFVALTGKARTFQPDDSDRIFTSVRPESISEVDAETRDRWTVDAAEQTLDRVEAMATAIALDASGDRLRSALVDRGVEGGLADGIALALDHYETTPTYLAAVRDLALDAARLVAGDVDEVDGLDLGPTATGDVTATDLLSEPVEPLAEPPAESDEEPGATEAASDAASADADDVTVADSSVAGAAGASEADTPGTAETEPATGSESTAETETDSASAATSETEESTGSEPTETEPAAAGEAAGAAASDTEATTPEAGSTATDAAATTTDAEAGAGDVGTDAAADSEADVGAEGPGDFEPGEFDLDEEEREEIEAEYGTEFQSGTEVEEPGAADIETPDPETDVEPAADAETAAGDSADEGTDGAAADDADAPEEEPDADLDLEDAAVEAMAELDEGDGAEHDTVVATVVNRTGADPEAVEDAIQDALMDGRCYEPDDATLKPI